MHGMSPASAVYQRIKDAILELKYRPGQKLSETKLASDLQVGRSPIRSALARLEKEGWVRVLPQSGTFVREISPTEVQEMAELRLLLESDAARKAATRIAPEDLRRLRAKFDALKAAGVDQRFDEFLALDDLFHSTIHHAAGNRRITEILRTLRDQIHWVRVTTAALPGRVAESLLEMDRVLDAMERRDPETAAEAMRQHIGNIATSFQSMPRPHDAKPEQ